VIALSLLSAASLGLAVLLGLVCIVLFIYAAAFSDGYEEGYGDGYDHAADDAEDCQPKPFVRVFPAPRGPQPELTPIPEEDQP
jgi:hypothetical protein